MDEIDSLLKHLSHHLQVLFALYCAKDAAQYLSDKEKSSATFCIELTQKWLDDNSSVTPHELYASYASSYAVKTEKLKQYVSHLENMINNLSKLEKALYNNINKQEIL